MKFIGSTCLLLAFLVDASSNVFEKKSLSLDREWTIKSRAAPTRALKLQVALTSNNRPILEQHALEIANPSGPRWRQHLSPAEIAAMLRPANETVQKVMSWLGGVGARGRLDRDVVLATVTVEQAESLLQTTYNVYEHLSGKEAIRTEHYSIPQHLRGHVDFVTPTVHFPHTIGVGLSTRRSAERRLAPAVGQPKPEPKVRIQQKYSNSPLVGPCGNGTYPALVVGPECIRAAYSVDWTPTNTNNSVAVYDIDRSNFNNTNLQRYLSQYKPEAARVNATFERLDAPGFNASSEDFKHDSPEIDQDTQIIMGLAWPARGYIIQANIDGINGNWDTRLTPEETAAGQDDFLAWLHQMAYNETVPAVVSFSAGANEDFVPYAYAQRACSMFAAAGARGVTFVFSSGDNGPVAQTRLLHNLTVDPQWPGACPWVTCVGATVNPFNETAATSNTAGYTSGGGFSNYFARPAWQDGVVPAYIDAHVDASFRNLSGFNASGRGYPDIAAFGDQVPAFTSPEGLFNADGTSASAPIVAALVAILNDYEASRGLPTLGYINPWLYSLKGGEIRDITFGNGSDYFQNTVGGPHPPVGYNGTIGWDALTGLGVPVFDKMRAALSKYQ